MLGTLCSELKAGRMQPATFNCTISIAIGLRITPKITLCNRVSKDAFVEA
jgi:hypothetical protein